MQIVIFTHFKLKHKLVLLSLHINISKVKSAKNSAQYILSEILLASLFCKLGYKDEKDV